MSVALKIKNYQYITNDPKIAGGEPIIEATRTTVRSIAGYYQMGMSVDEILIDLPHLTISQVHSALAFFFDHQTEIEKDMEKNASLEYWNKELINK